MKTLCGIVTYNPNINRLTENITEVIQQVDKVIIFDNGSENIDFVKKLIEQQFGNYELICNPKNIGIAGALKAIMNYAVENNYDWVLSLDQDSVLQKNTVKEYLKYIEIPKVGGIICSIKDRNIKDDMLSGCEDVIEIETCITSGFFCSVKAYLNTSGYDEFMFIDGVDFDICNSLRRSGYKIIKIPHYGLLHELGNMTENYLFGRKFLIGNHSPWRRYYIARNAIYEAKKFPEYYSIRKVVRSTINGSILVLLFEKDKYKKIKNTYKGIIDGLKIRIDEK